MSQTYIINIKNLNYFIYSLKKDIISVNAVSYDETTHTIEISGAFTENDKTNLDSFISTYINPEKVTVSKTKMLSTVLTQSSEKDWVTVSTWVEDSSITDLTIISRLQPSPGDSLYQEIFRYGVRIVDITNNLIINELEFYNSEYEKKIVPITGITLSLGNINLEVQVKKYNKGTFVYISNVALQYV